MIFPPHKVWVWLALASGLSRFALAADTQPPAVAITQPVNGTTLSGKSTVVKVTASDASGITNVALKIDGAARGASLQVSPYNFMVDTSTLANGVQTLMAVATDGAGNAARSALVSVNVTNPPRYKLGQGPFVVEDRGSPISANTQDKQIMFRLSNGDVHLLMYYDILAKRGTIPIQIVDINISQGTARVVDGPLGRPGPQATVLCTNNNNIYLGSSDPAYLFEYSPLTGETNNLGLIGQSSSQYTQIGDDGWVYVGGYGQGAVTRFNPVTRVKEYLGPMDTDAGVGNQYAYTLGADTRFLYIGLGENPWFLSIYNTQTGTKTNYWKADADLASAVYRGKGVNVGNWYYRRNVAGVGNQWYLLSNGVPVAVGAPAYFNPWDEKGNVISASTLFPSNFNLEINLEDAMPMSGATNAIVRWRTVGATNWSSVTVTNLRIAPVAVKRAHTCPWDVTKLLGFADSYGPVFLYDTSSRVTIPLGFPQYALLNSLFENGIAFFSGYPAATIAYDPSMPWTLSASASDKSSPTVNPHKVAATFGKYHYYSTFGADGLVYIGAHHERDSTGGELGWYDPLRGTKGSLRDPFLNDDVRDLKPALGGTKLVYASNNEKLFIFDVATKQIERVITPLPGVGPLDKIVEVATGIIFGATSNRVFKVDIRDGSVLYTNTLPGQAFGGPAILAYDRRLVLGPDGFVWLFIGNSLYRINPADGVMTKLMDTPAKSLLFKDGDLYLYGGPNLYRIQGVLRSALCRPPSALHIIP